MEEATAERLSPNGANGAKVERGPLTVHARPEGGSYVIELCGELDLSNVGALQEAVARAGGTGASEIVLDLSALQFIDASGLRVLSTAETRAREGATPPLRVLRPPPPVQRLLQLTGLDRRLTVLD